MEELAKLIWDFRGPNAALTAKHHEVHLKEYFAIEGILVKETGTETQSEFSSTAYCIVGMNVVQDLRTALKPHRGQRYTNHK